MYLRFIFFSFKDILFIYSLDFHSFLEVAFKINGTNLIPYFTCILNYVLHFVLGLFCLFPAPPIASQALVQHLNHDIAEQKHARAFSRISRFWDEVQNISGLLEVWGYPPLRD